MSCLEKLFFLFFSTAASLQYYIKYLFLQMYKAPSAVNFYIHGKCALSDNIFFFFKEALFNKEKNATFMCFTYDELFSML